MRAQHPEATGQAAMAQVLDTDKAQAFAEAWLDAWNRHDLDAILAHYSEDVDFRSPFVAQLTSDPRGRLKGKTSLRSYVAMALARYPHLHFEPRHVYRGADSVTIEYRSVLGLVAAECFTFDALGQACEVRCHYREED